VRKLVRGGLAPPQSEVRIGAKQQLKYGHFPKTSKSDFGFVCTKNRPNEFEEGLHFELPVGASSCQCDLELGFN
jgi:hypothetical protein